MASIDHDPLCPYPQQDYTHPMHRTCVCNTVRKTEQRTIDRVVAAVEGLPYEVIELDSEIDEWLDREQVITAIKEVGNEPVR